MNSPFFKTFAVSVAHIPLPERFTFPFYYTPHPLSILAAEELQHYLEKQRDFEHEFGSDEEPSASAIGKMFGVLVVQNKDGELGYLSAFSGKLAGKNHHEMFVPPVFDILDQDGFYKREEEFVNEVNRALDRAEKNPDYITKKNELQAETKRSIDTLTELKERIRLGKNERKRARQEASTQLSAKEFEEFMLSLSKQSIKEQYHLKDQIAFWKKHLAEIQAQFDVFQNEIDALKEKRKFLSSKLQEKIFQHYDFLNINGNRKSLQAIFEHILPLNPPAGAGECAAPKLLEHAFLYGLKPIALAEFWWGQSPASEVRKHKMYYPACRGKCEPILGHMLEGIVTDPNPMLENPAEGKELITVYEDDFLLVVNKPHEFLSVPGITIKDSVYERIKKMYPDATGPLIVHRLDMSTSGLMLVAKTKEVHKKLQSLFIKRSIKKRYEALLNSEIVGEEGIIDLPLRVDLDDRPRQLVCYEYGKTARTKWEVLERMEGKTKVSFYPITGRTHQLRVHAAHPQGLNAAIVGDDLYGTKANRLHLHAAYLEFKHPVSKEIISFEVRADF